MFSQSEANIWMFGQNAGLDFNSGSPALIIGSAMYTVEGSASIADANGDLLFYTNGARANKIWTHYFIKINI